MWASTTDLPDCLGDRVRNKYSDSVSHRVKS